MASPSVLIADPQRLAAHALGIALGRRGFIVVGSHPTFGWAAVDEVLEHRPDIALLDYWLLGTQAVVATTAIRRRLPQQKVLISGWFCGRNEIEHVLHSGSVGFVSKAARMKDLAEVIDKAIEGRFPVADPETAPIVQDICRAHPGEVGAWDCGEVETLRDLGALTRREVEVLELLALGIRMQEVAVMLEVRATTVRSHLDNVFKKTKTRSQVELIGMARNHGLIQA